MCNTKGTSKGKFICESFAQGVKISGDEVSYIGREIAADLKLKDREQHFQISPDLALTCPC